VEGVGKILSVRKNGLNRFVTIQAPAGMHSRLIPEGSVAVDGISLTIAQRAGNTFMLNIIPETWKAVSLCKKRPGSPVNLETDLFLRHSGFLKQAFKMQTINVKKLKDWGYME
jgi:riboflavin synthase